jgi:hypothetical protein
MAEWVAPGFVLWGTAALVYPRAMFDPAEGVSEMQDGRSLDPMPILAFAIGQLLGATMNLWVL